jgi:hypothetical protein
VPCTHDLLSVCVIQPESQNKSIVSRALSSVLGRPPMHHKYTCIKAWWAFLTKGSDYGMSLWWNGLHIIKTIPISLLG